MHSTTRATDPIASTARSSTTAVTDGALRVVYNAVRTLVPEASTLTVERILGVTRLDPAVAAAAMDRSGRASPLSIPRLDTGRRVWLIRRTDR